MLLFDVAQSHLNLQYSGERWHIADRAPEHTQEAGCPIAWRETMVSNAKFLDQHRANSASKIIASGMAAAGLVTAIHRYPRQDMSRFDISKSYSTYRG